MNQRLKNLISKKILMFLISLFERIVILLNMRFGKIEKIIYS
jgi:hypothetical protein